MVGDFLTNSMVQGPSWEPNFPSAIQEMPLILCKPNVQYRVHKTRPHFP